MRQLCLVLCLLWGCGRVGYDLLESQDAGAGNADAAASDTGAQDDAGPPPPRTLTPSVLGGVDIDIAFSFAMNASGQHAIAGGAGATADLGLGASSAEPGTFVTAFDGNGVTAWVERVGGTGTDRANGVSIDDNGTVFVVGEFRPDFDLGGGMLPNRGNIDGFAGQFASTGNHLMSAAGGSTANDLFHHSAPYGLGLVAVGNHGGAATFGTETVPHVSGSDSVMVRYDEAGSVVVAQNYGASGADQFRGVDVRSDGRIYVAGYFSGTARNTALGEDAVLLCLSSSGAIDWEVNLSGSGNARFFGVAVGPGNSAYLVGEYSGEGSLGTVRLPTAVGTNIVVAAVLSDGTVAWAETAGSGGAELAHGVAVRNDRLYVTGQIRGPLTLAGLPLAGPTDSRGSFVARLDARSGAGVWGQVVEGATLLGVGASDGGLVAAGGYFSGSFRQPDGVVINGFGGSDVVIVRFQEPAPE